MFLPKWPNFQKFQQNINNYHIDRPNINDLKLEKVLALFAKFSNPQNKLKNVIHVAGTNGKGSFIAFLRAMLEEQNYKVNCYTSPHLIDFNERIRIKGKLISDAYLTELGEYAENICNKYPELEPSFFEGTTLLAFLAFAQHQADFNIIETGMGGRLDATNIFNNKIATILMPIGYDHQEFLGDNLLDIAAEKAGIILPNSNVYIAKQEPQVNKFLQQHSKEKQAKACFFAEDFDLKQKKYSDQKLSQSLNIDHIPLLGEHQQENLAVALKVFFEITNYQYKNISLKNVNWPGRIEKLNNLPAEYNQQQIWLDGGHNEHAANALVKWLNTEKIDYIIIAMNNNKDFTSYINKFIPLGIKLIFTEMNRYEHAYKITDVIQYKEHFIAMYKDFRQALTDINKINKSAKILICGSLYLVAEVTHCHCMELS